MSKFGKFSALAGSYISPEYRLPNGNRIECEFDGDRCFGIAAIMDFIFICT